MTVQPTVVATRSPDGAGELHIAGIVPKRVRATVAERLPHYMMPGQVLPLNRFPVGPSGKVNKEALPPPASGRVPAQEAGSALADLEEATMVAEVFTEILDVQAVPADTDFFELGSNSLQAVRLLNRLRKRIDGGVSLATLIKRPTVAGSPPRSARPGRHDRPRIASDLMGAFGTQTMRQPATGAGEHPPVLDRGPVRAHLAGADDNGLTTGYLVRVACLCAFPSCSR